MIRRAAFGAWLVLHRLATIALAAALILLVLLAGGAWRLAQGPVDLGWLTGRLQAAANANGGGLHLSIGRTALVWEGFRLGVDRPLDLRLTDVAVTANGTRRVDIPQAEVSLSLSALLHGQVQPRALELDHPRLTLRRGENGGISIDLGGTAPAPGPTPEAEPMSASLAALLAVLARPTPDRAAAGPRWFSQLQRVRIHDGVVTVIDRNLGATWSAPQADITLLRQPRGGIAGTVDLILALGNQHASLIAAATVSPDATATRVTARLGQVEPATLARAAPTLGFLAAVDAPVSVEATADLSQALDVQQARIAVRMAAGTLHIAGGSVPVLGGHLSLSGTPAAFRVDDAALRLRAPPGDAATTLTASGTVQRDDTQLEAGLSLGLDQVSFAGLAALWPPGLASNARTWVTQNITAGVAQAGHVTIGLAANADLSDLTLTSLSGSLDGSGLTVWWLRPVPPIVNGQAVLRLVDPDTLQIDVASGQEPLRNGGSLAITGGGMRVTGLMQHDQVGAITAQISGSLADAVALLSEPRLQLLARHPLPVTRPSGDLSATLAVTVPLDAAVRIDDIGIKANARVTDAFLGGVVAGRDLSGGTLDLAASNDGLTVHGTARLAGIPVSLDAAMDFRAGPPDQVLQRFAVNGTADAKALAATGLDATDVLSGPVGVQAVMIERRNGAGTLTAAADLTGATLTLAPLAWRKPAGSAARASAELRFDHDRLDRVEAIRAAGPGLLLRGSAAVTDGRITQVQLDSLTLGRTTLQGSLVLPPAAHDGPIVVRVSGPMLDLAPRLDQPATKVRRKPGPPQRTPPSPPGPPWTLDARVDRVLMAHGYLLAPLTVQAQNDGSVYRRLTITGFTRANGAFAVHIAPEGGQRRLSVTAASAGDLLRALDVTSTMQGGALRITGSYDDTTPAHTLHGTIELNEFRVAQAAALGKLLQAMTLYGLVDALRGPGLRFSRLLAPFTFEDGVLRLNDARAFSPSLGLTAKGWIDLDANTAGLQGTIVPAYFFNSLLGDVPVVGRLFSPERGGGVFAATYGLHGDLDDPTVSVNPLSALTPGFLRGLFGLL